MAWWDGFAAVDYALNNRRVTTTGYKPFKQPSFGPRPQQSARGINWSDLSSGRLATARAPRQPAGVPERFEVEYPYSSTGPRSPYAPPPPTAPQSTKGDLGASFGAALGQVPLNLGNVLPFFLERHNTLANDFASSVADTKIPGVKGVADALAWASDRFIDGANAAAQVAGPVLDGFPSWVRDSQLKDRAKLYRAIANGETPDFGLTGPASSPIATLGHIAGLLNPVTGSLLRDATGSANPLAGLTGTSVSEQAYQAKRWQDILLHSVDPQKRLHAEQRMAILRDSIDLPESVKLQIENSPRATDDEVAKWLDAAPEGKQWSYAAGAGGVAQNIGNALLFFGAEVRAGFGAARGIGAFGQAMGGTVGAGIGAAARVASVTAKLERAAVASGIGITAVNTTMGAIARYQGDEEAIAWFDNANRTTEFSDDPMVQLVTGFSVNPFAAVGLLKKGTIATKHGIEAVVDKVTAGKLLNHFGKEDVMLERIRRMYQLGSRDEASRFLDEQGLREQAYDEAFRPALDLVLDRLPAKERIAFNGMYPDPAERSIAAMARYGGQAEDLWRSDPDLVARRFNDHDWNYRGGGMLGDFTPEKAATIAVDYRNAMTMTHDIRAKQGLVIGYREAFPPQAQTIAKSMLDDVTTPEGRVTVGDFQDLQVRFPVLGRFWGGSLKGGPASTPLARADVDRVLEAASADWARMAKVNPQRATSGIDPVLRPDSPTLQRDYAEALGTNVDTIEALSKFDPKSAAHADLLGAFARDKLDIDPTGKSPQELWSIVGEHVDTVTQPWREMGNRVAKAETQMARLRGELVRIKREGGRTESDRTVRVQREINELADLVRLAGDPIQTAASRAAADAPVRGLADSHLAELAARKVDALERLRVVQSVSDELSAAGLNETHLSLVVRGADGELAWAYDLLGAPPTPVLAAYLRFRTAAMQVTRSVKGELTSRRQQERGLTVKGQELVRFTEEAPGSYQWAQIASSPGFVRRLRQIGDEEAFDQGMTGNEMADIVEAAGLAKGVSGEALDDIAIRMTETREAAAKARLTGTLGGETAIARDRVAEGIAANKAVSDARGGTAESGGAIKGPAPEPYTPETALQRLADLKAAREKALDGKGVPALKRTASIKVSDDYVAQATADRAARDLVYDAEYDAFWHPRAVAKVQEITGSPDELYPGLRAVVEGDPALAEGIGRIASRTGLTPDDILNDPAHAAAVRAELVPAGFEPPIEGLVREWTDLDHLITSGDAEKIAALSEQFAAARAEPRPPTSVPRHVAERLASIPKTRRSYQYRRAIADAHGDFKASPSARILDDPANRTGVEVLSVLNHSIPGTRPATIDGVIALIRDIENGAATRMGVGPELQAEAQRVARALLDDAVKAARKDPNIVGIQTKGAFVEDEQALAATLDDLLSFDQADPIGTLQYGLKKAPKDAVVMEWSKIPGLAEEIMSGRFEPWAERVGTTQVRQAINWVFGKHSNAAIRQEAKNIFVERLGRQGITPVTAAGIWDGWATMAHDSRLPAAIRNARGKKIYVQGDSPRFADVRNIPNHALDAEVKGIRGRTEPGIIEKLNQNPRTALSAEEMAIIDDIDFAREFRESTSFIRRTLADSKVPLGRALADAYGLAVHNRVATTYYYWLRFAMDTRYHAMNYMEAQILHWGRAGLRKGEIDEGLLGQSKGYLRTLDQAPEANTGYPFTRDRHEWAYKTMLKEQPDALRTTLRNLDPDVADRAIREMALSDPQLRDMIRELDGFAPGQKLDPTKYLKELDTWHGKMLANVDELSDARVIDEALAKEMANTPHLAELFDRLGQTNKDLWANIRETFYGNPNRSRAERFLNQWIMFWPISYQIKATKWFARVLFDRAGGLQTNALGAVQLDRMAETHNRLLATDPEYRDWFEKHDTLVFVAQMFFPVSFDSMGVSLNPVLRGIFFDRDPLRALEIGPIYTYNKVIRPIAEELEVDLYPTIRDFQAGLGIGESEPAPIR